MKAWEVLSFSLILIPSLAGSQDTSAAFFNHLRSANEQHIVGRCGAGVILPCSFKSGPEVVIHWHYQNNSKVHSYYNGQDHLERQHPRYADRTFLFHREIPSGNASLAVRRLGLLDEGIYVCYVGTVSGHSTHKVVLKVGAFHSPFLKYEKRNTDGLLTCGISSAYPRPQITWRMDNTSVPESDSEETGYPGPFHVHSTLNITGSNSSYECTIVNSLLKQTWKAQGTWEGGHRKVQSESMSLSCQAASRLSPPNQDVHVTWSRVESGTSSILAWYLSSSQNTIVNEPRFSWNQELINQSDFSMTLADLSPSDTGEYVCNISSKEYTSLTVYSLHVAPAQGTFSWKTFVPVFVVLLTFLIMMLIFRHKLRRCYAVSTDTCWDSVDMSSNSGDNSEEDVSLSEESDSTGNEDLLNTRNMRRSSRLSSPQPT